MKDINENKIKFVGKNIYKTVIWTYSKSGDTIGMSPQTLIVYFIFISLEDLDSFKFTELLQYHLIVYLVFLITFVKTFSFHFSYF